MSKKEEPNKAREEAQAKVDECRRMVALSMRCLATCRAAKEDKKIEAETELLAQHKAALADAEVELERASTTS